MIGRKETAVRGGRDMENTLTDAVNHALTRMDSLERVNTEKTQVGDTRTQMKLLAEQLCRRIQRKYETRIREEREKERNEVERRLRDISTGYKRDLETMRSEYERERMRIMERMDDERKEMHIRVDMRIAEKEEKLEMEKNRLDTRLRELVLNKEQMDLARVELNATIQNEMQRCKLEMERLAQREYALKKEEERVAKGSHLVFANERHNYEEKIRILENTLSDMGHQLAKAGAENVRLQEKLVDFAATQAELTVAKENYRRQVEENISLSERIRNMADYDVLKRTVKELKEQITRTQNVFDVEAQKAQASLQLELQHSQLKVKEFKTTVGILTERVIKLEREKDELREKIRETRRRGREEKTERIMEKTVERAMVDEEESSIVSEVSSEEGVVREMKDRMRNLYDISRELDETMRNLELFNRDGNHVLNNKTNGLERILPPQQQHSSSAMGDVECSSPPPLPPITPIRSPPLTTIPAVPPKEPPLVASLPVSTSVSAPLSEPPTIPIPSVPQVSTLPPVSSPSLPPPQSSSSLPPPPQQREVAPLIPPDVDPVMAQYMRLLMNQGVQKEENPRTITTEAVVEEVEEDYVLDGDDPIDDAIDW